MPNRILHERICVSETIAQLTADEERFFYRLIVQCDDYGRFDGRPSVIRARCFALQIDEVDDEDVARWLAVLVNVGLIATYVVDGRTFLQVTTWERYQQTRAKRSKFPDPASALQAPDSNGYHAPAYVPENRESLSEKREPESGDRESLRDSTPQPPPQAEGEFPPTPRKRGARKGRERANGHAVVETEAPPVLAVSEADRQTWSAALEVVRLSVSRSNFETWIKPLLLVGRGAGGELHLRAPPGQLEACRQYRHFIARALDDAGDPHGARVAIVE